MRLQLTLQMVLHQTRIPQQRRECLFLGQEVIVQSPTTEAYAGTDDEADSASASQSAEGYGRRETNKSLAWATVIS